MTKILVTGGAGYVGSHVCRGLSRRTKHEIKIIDSLERGHEWAVKGFDFTKVDLRDKAGMDAVFAAFKPEIVMHFAAFAQVGESVENPSLYYENNVIGTLNLLEAMRAHGVSNIVFSSTCAVYGTPQHAGKLNEEHPIKPINPYGATKAMMEQALADYGAYGIRSVALRYFNAAGADESGEIGECHEPETHALPLMIRAALGRGEFTLFGEDYPTPDGTAIRDYIHVADLADAHIRAAEYLHAGGQTIALNLGTGKGTSVRQLVDAVEAVTGKSVPHKVVGRRAGDAPVLVADASLAAIILDWRPRHTELNDIVRSALGWHQKEKA